MPRYVTSTGCCSLEFSPAPPLNIKPQLPPLPLPDFSLSLVRFLPTHGVTTPDSKFGLASRAIGAALMLDKSGACDASMSLDGRSAMTGQAYSPVSSVAYCGPVGV